MFRAFSFKSEIRFWFTLYHLNIYQDEATRIAKFHVDSLNFYSVGFEMNFFCYEHMQVRTKGNPIEKSKNNQKRKS